jgi:hypothetical protein
MFKFVIFLGLGVSLLHSQPLLAQEDCSAAQKVEPLSDICQTHMVRLRGWIQSGFAGRISPNSKKLVKSPRDNPAAYAKDIDMQCRTNLMDSFLLDADNNSVKEEWKALPRRVAAVEGDPFSEAFNDAGRDNTAKKTLAKGHEQITQQVIDKQEKSFEQLISVLDFFVLATTDGSQLAEFQQMRNTISGNVSPENKMLYTSNQKCNVSSRMVNMQRQQALQVANQQHKLVASPNLDELIRRTVK